MRPSPSTTRADLPDLDALPAEGALSLREVHAALARILEVVVHRLDEAGIEHCLIGGGCIGIARHGGEMVPWDDDLDVAVWIDDIPRVLDSLANLPPPFALHHEPPGHLPCCRVTDRSTQLVGPDGAKWSLGVFVDIIPMMCWPSTKWIALNQLLEGFGPRSEVRYSSRRWKRLIKRLAYVLHLERSVQSVRDRIVRPWLLRQHQRGRSASRGIVSGTISAPWAGRYPWSTVFPAVDRELAGVRVKSPRDLHDFLVRRYGPRYRDVQEKEFRWTHFKYALREVPD
jgi:hypothetical protein